MMNTDDTLLPALFKSGDRIRILRSVSLQGTVSVRGVSVESETSKGLASLYLNLLADHGLVIRHNRAFHRKDSDLWRAIKLLLNLDLLRPHLSLPPWAKGIGIYGSWARGTNTSDSDLDVWVLAPEYSPDLEFRVAESDQDLSKVTNGPVHTLILTREKLDFIARTDRPFYENLIRNHVTIDGESLEPA